METFAHTRGKQTEFSQAENNMPYEYDLETDRRYLQGKAVGEQKGKQEESLRKDTEHALRLYDKLKFSPEAIAEALDLNLTWLKEVLRKERGWKEGKR